MTIDSAFISTLINKIVKYDKTVGVMHNGEDNNYPELIESLIANSVTALRCKELMSSYISGKGFGKEENKTTVHEGKGISLLKFTQDVSESLSEQNGVYIHVNYNLEHEISDMQVLPFTDCRIGRQDSNRYNGKILVCSDWSNRKKAKKAKAVDVYNSDPKVIDTQIEKAGSSAKYNGQILFFHFGKYTYPLSNIHPCIEDADSEKQTSVYKNKSLRKGFFGKMLVVTRPMIDDLNDEGTDEYNKQLSKRDEFRSTIGDFIGAENVDGVMHFEMEFDTDKLEDSILFKQIDSNIDDKLFEHTERSCGYNLMMCFNNVPTVLIRSQDVASFGDGGGQIVAAKEFYQDQTTNYRLSAEQIISRLMKRHVNKLENLNLIPLIEVQTTKEAA